MLTFAIGALVGAAFAWAQLRSGLVCPTCGGKTCPNHGCRHVP